MLTVNYRQCTLENLFTDIFTLTAWSWTCVGFDDCAIKRTTGNWRTCMNTVHHDRSCNNCKITEPSLATSSQSFLRQQFFFQYSCFWSILHAIDGNKVVVLLSVRFICCIWYCVSCRRHMFSSYVYWPIPRASVTSHSNGWALRVASAD